mgnify:CR=1 FL=1
MNEEVKLMKGNDALALAAIRYGADGYFGYPITPQSEVLECLEAEMPWETTGMVVLQAESDALIVKGIVALLIRVLSGHSPQEVLHADLYFIEQIGLKEHLSPTRSNGLLAMLKQIKMYALVFSSKQA